MWRIVWAWLRYGWACVVWAVQSVGYLVRPYDALLDARRWRWQPRGKCGHTAVLAEAIAEGHACRVMFTRLCPRVYRGPCGDRPCARFESEDPAPWEADLQWPSWLT